ncbi:DedA family protein [Porphyromonas canoris]|uniref:Membrane protein n=1 Tax=Porphyromonas canoris TaxID=36875 RepID=A0ABR4XJZ4_9PORP|nr:DedA family protein [Porphyromonas canoris]KGN92003.1 membrane protein [Porphyromonas canoris]
MDTASLFQWALESLDYFTITLLMIIESSFIPFPSEVVIPPAAYKAAATGELNVYLVVLFGTIGATIGALINYYLALFLGRKIVYRFANSRIGAMCLINEAKVQKAESFFYKNGIISTLMGRLVPGIRQLISIPAGLAKMKLPQFILYTFIGAGVWNAILAAMGYYFASFVPQDKLMDYVMKNSHLLGYIFMGIAAIIVAVLIYKGSKRPSKS